MDKGINFESGNQELNHSLQKGDDPIPSQCQRGGRHSWGASRRQVLSTCCTTTSRKVSEKVSSNLQETHTPHCHHGNIPPWARLTGDFVCLRLLNTSLQQKRALENSTAPCHPLLFFVLVPVILLLVQLSGLVTLSSSKGLLQHNLSVTPRARRAVAVSYSTSIHHQ